MAAHTKIVGKNCKCRQAFCSFNTNPTNHVLLERGNYCCPVCRSILDAKAQPAAQEAPQAEEDHLSCKYCKDPIATLYKKHKSKKSTRAVPVCLPCAGVDVKQPVSLQSSDI